MSDEISAEEPAEQQTELVADDESESSEHGDTEYEPGQKRPLDHGVKVRAKVKRGTGTRDQDELLLEGRGEDAAEAAADFEDVLSHAEEQGWSDRLRDLQPGQGEDDADA